MADCGMAGATLSWPDYAAGLDQLEADLLPLMEARGLRHAQGGARVRDASVGTVPTCPPHSA
jgi:hypothetical protein